MLEDFLSYIEYNLSVNREDKILLSISGGVDSMVMLQLFRQLDYKIIVAHINHSTRKGESDLDMSFIEAYCAEHSISFYSKTLNYKHLTRGNFQENARKARFAFLEEIFNNQDCKWMATAHHKDDRWETFLMHLNRKSGIQGLTSLRPKENKIIHPLLFTTKKQILEYAKIHNIDFVHDKSNDSDAYLRNSIRHNATPNLVKIFPDFIENVNESINHLEQTSSLLKELIVHSNLVSQSSQSSYSIVWLKKVKTFEYKHALLHHILADFGFNYSTTCDILNSNTTGALFESSSNEALLDREKLIIRPKKTREKTDLTIDAPGLYQLPSGKKLKVETNPQNDSRKHLWLDVDKIKFPITIRNIQPGDKFKPFGMHGSTKTIKKLCTDLKINRFDKEEMLLICDADQILQIVEVKSSHNYTTADIKKAVTFRIVD